MNKFIASSIWADPTMLVTLMLLVALGGMLLYSVRKRRNVRETIEKMLDELRPGQRIRTVGGVIGRIKEIREEAPGIKTVLLLTGNDKYPAYMLFDIQAIYGIIAEEGHTIDGAPLPKTPATGDTQTSPEPKLIPLDDEAPEKTDLATDFNARDYVEKRNAVANKSKKKK